MRVETKCIIISRKPREDDKTFKTASIAFFEKNDAHKLGIAPTQTKDFPDTEKVLLTGLDVSYYLEGNDLLINDLTSVTIDEQEKALLITGEQE